MFAPPGSGGATGPILWPTCNVPHCGAPVCIDSTTGHPSRICAHHFQEGLQFQQQQQYAQQQFFFHQQQQQQQQHQQQRQQPQQYVPQQQFYPPEQHGPYPYQPPFRSMPISNASRRKLQVPKVRRPHRGPLTIEDEGSVDGESIRSVDVGHRSVTPSTPNRARFYSAPDISVDDRGNVELTSEAGQDPPHSAPRVARETDSMVIFWKPPCTFSQWVPSTFYVDNVKYYSSGQFMAACKAALFDDQKTLRAILDTEDPAKHIYYGLQVPNFDQALWDRMKKQFALMGNYQKFKQNLAMCEELVATGNKVLVAASSLDNVWSVGLDVSDPDAEHRERWTGQNLLGEALMKVRQLILLEKPELSSRFVDAVLSSRAPVEGNDQTVPTIVNGVIVWI